jgi:bacillithiol system protein YtxJ
MGNPEATAERTDEHIVPVKDQEELERLFTASAEQPVVLFKHEYGCPVSTHAYWEIAALPYDVSLIDVARQRPLSLGLADRLNIRHESPQVIVLRNGQPVYDASHWDITRDDVTRAVTGA